MPYSHTRWSELQTALLARLDNPTATFWAVDEVRRNLAEAVRILQSLTAMWRDRAQFTTTAGTAFYDLQGMLPAANQLGTTLTDADLVKEIQYHLEEPVAWPWTGSTQFTASDGSDILAAIQRRRDQFFDDTGCRVRYHAPFSVPSGDGRVDLSDAITGLGLDTIISIRRAQWISSRGVYSNLFADTVRNVSFNINPLSSGMPYAYDTISTTPLVMRLLPMPIDGGRLELLTIETGTALTGLGVSLGVPDNLAWGVKYGALSDLFSKAGTPAHDSKRAEICDKLYTLAITTAGMMGLAAGLEIDGKTDQPDPLYMWDVAYPNWQGQRTGNPTDSALAGLNMLALRPVPNAGNHSVMVDMIVNAPVPGVVDGSHDTDFVQIPRELVGPLLDCAVTISHLKLGSYEHGMALSTHFQRFLDAAKGYALKEDAIAYASTLLFPGNEDERVHPRRRDEGAFDGAPDPDGRKGLKGARNN